MRCTWVIVCCLAFSIAAQQEGVPALTPLAARAGGETEVAFANDTAGKPTGLWTSFPADVTRLNDARFRLRIPATCPVGIYATRLLTTSGASSLQLLMVDDLPTVRPAAGNRLPAPCAIEADVPPSAVVTYRVAARRGQRLSVDIVAARLGSRLDPIVRLLDPADRELAYCDDAPGIAPDARLTSSAPVDGDYKIELRDVNYEGGQAYHYRLRVGDFALPTPAFPPKGGDFIASSREPKIALPINIAGRLSSASQRDAYVLELKVPTRIAIGVRARSLGSRCEPLVRVIGPDGQPVAEQRPPEPKSESKPPPPITEATPLVFNLPTAGSYRILVEDLARIAAPDAVYRLEIESSAPGFDLTTETDLLVAAPGGSAKLKVRCARRQLGGPIALRLEDVRGGQIELVTSSLASGQIEGDVEVKLLSSRATTFRLVGSAESDAGERTRELSTLPAIQKAFPRLLYPPGDLDGVVMIAPKAP